MKAHKENKMEKNINKEAILNETYWVAKTSMWAMWRMTSAMGLYEFDDELQAIKAAMDALNRKMEDHFRKEVTG